MTAKKTAPAELTTTVEGDQLTAALPDGRVIVLSLRMSARKLIDTVKVMGDLEAEKDVAVIMSAIETVAPHDLLDDPDLDFVDTFQIFGDWTKALAERVGKALT